MAERSNSSVRGQYLRAYAWVILLAVGLLLVGVHQLLPRGPARDVVNLTTAALGPLGLLLGLRLHRPQRRRAWTAMAAGQLVWVAADLVYTVQKATDPTRAFPTEADILYLAGYPLLGLALFLLTHGRRPRRDIEGALDSLTVAVGLYLLCWVLLARPTLDEAARSWVAAAVAVAYPLLDVTLMAMTVALVTTPGTRTAALRLLAASIGLVVVADTAASGLGLLAVVETDPIDFVWLLSYVFVGAAALHPSMQTLSTTTPPGPATMSWRRQASGAVAVLVAPGTLAAQHLLGVPVDIWAVVIASALMFLLVVARMNVAMHQIVTANRGREEAQAELVRQAAHDSLTGLPNRTRSLELLASTLSRAQRTGAMTGLLFVDLDGFKAVNDTFGHGAGDDVLRAVAQRMAAVVRASDLVGRLGGDEFVVVLDPLVDEHAAVVVGDRLVAEVSRPVYRADGQEVSVGASVGVAISQDGRTDAGVLLVEADTAAYRAKRRGRGRTEVFDAGVRQELESRRELEHGLRAALQDHQLELRFSPVMDLVVGVPQGWEAVLHWDRPGVGLVSVPELPSVADNAELVIDLGVWALHRAARQIADWEAAGLGPVVVSLPVAMRHLGRARVVEDVRTALEHAGVAAGALMVQASDLDVVDDPAVLDNLARLRSGGTPVSLDSFGVGRSSLRRLAQLPVDAVTLDGSLLDQSSDAVVVLLDLMVRGAQRFGLRTAVRGVRSAEDVGLLLRVDCRFAQGQFFGGPFDATEVVRQLRVPVVRT